MPSGITNRLFQIAFSSGISAIVRLIRVPVCTLSRTAEFRTELPTVPTIDNTARRARRRMLELRAPRQFRVESKQSAELSAAPGDLDELKR